MEVPDELYTITTRLLVESCFGEGGKVIIAPSDLAILDLEGDFGVFNLVEI